MSYRVYFKTGEPSSQLIENVRFIEIIRNILYIQTVDGTIFEFGLSEIDRLINVKHQSVFQVAKKLIRDASFYPIGSAQ